MHMSRVAELSARSLVPAAYKDCSGNYEETITLETGLLLPCVTVFVAAMGFSGTVSACSRASIASSC